MARNSVRLNRAGISEILKSADMHRAVQALAETVADNVRHQNIKVGDRDGGKHEYDLPVKVEVGTTDRARAVVLINHPSGAAVQAKHGVLTKAASEAGLKVRGK